MIGWVQLGPDPLPALGQIPDPIEWIRGKIEEFYRLPAQIGAQKARARKLLEIARAKGDVEAQAKLETALAELSRTQQEWYATQAKLAALMETLGSVGIGLGSPVPAVALALAATAAAAMAATFFAYKRQKDLIDAVERGILTPEQAARLKTTIGISLGGVGILIPIALAFLLLRRR
jgi:hypothetical protein